MGEPSVHNGNHVNAHSVADNLGGNHASITVISRRRGRRPLTTESAQSAADSQILVSLGMSPFMPGQDAVYNQNRFVRNEAILARRLSYLEHSYERGAELGRTQMTTEIQSLLDDYKATIDKLLADKRDSHSSTIPSALAALHQDYEEMWEAVHAILQHICSASTSNQNGIQRLNHAIRNARPEQVVLKELSFSSSESINTSSHAHWQEPASTERSPWPVPSNQIISDHSRLGIMRMQQDHYLGRFSRPPKRRNTMQIYPIYQQNEQMDNSVVRGVAQIDAGAVNIRFQHDGERDKSQLQVRVSPDSRRKGRPWQL